MKLDDGIDETLVSGIPWSNGWPVAQALAAEAFDGLVECYRQRPVTFILMRSDLAFTLRQHRCVWASSVMEETEEKPR